MPSACLINMNARLYDPQLGRFMSADSIVPDPFDGQSMNRFSYVNNNPLNATDPSGNVSPVETVTILAWRLIKCVECGGPGETRELQNSGGPSGMSSGDGGSGDKSANSKGKDQLCHAAKAVVTSNQFGTIVSALVPQTGNGTFFVGANGSAGYIAYGGVGAGVYLDTNTGEYGTYLSYELGAGIGVSAGPVIGFAKSPSALGGDNVNLGIGTVISSSTGYTAAPLPENLISQPLTTLTNPVSTAVSAPSSPSVSLVVSHTELTQCTSDGEGG